MKIQVFKTGKECGAAAAERAAETLRNAIADKGNAAFVAATGAFQFEFLKELTKQTSIDWRRTTMFHLDEYIGLPEDHPASFRRYLRERLIDLVHPGTVHLIQGDVEDPYAECRRLNTIVSAETIDVAFVGIGENGHLAFNDPPADFDTEEPYIVVELDEACRKQQMGEGWFSSIDDVPRQAISMSIKQIMEAQAVISVCSRQEESRGRQRMPGGRDLAMESRIDPEKTFQCLSLSRQKFRLASAENEGNRISLTSFEGFSHHLCMKALAFSTAAAALDP